MTYGLYSIYDVKSQVYLPPFMAKTVGEADRIFDSVIKSGQSTISEYPADHSLYQVGTFDDCGAVIEGVTPVFISKGDSHV